jgi:hypothetical protein
MSDQKKILTELERQQKAIDELPPQYTFPLFNSRKALESQRQSGYRTTAAAVRELIDNAVEAGASKVHVFFDRAGPGADREQKKKVAAVAVVDDGSGMLPAMARFALSWGGGTHFDEHDFIGKFGFGLPNASINQSRRVDVYTRTELTEPIWCAYLDIDEYRGEGTLQEIHPAHEADLPQFVRAYLEKLEWTFDRGTVVVWSKPDRLSYKKAASLREHLLDDFGVTYRYLLKDFELVVEGTRVEKVDPLFLDADARFYVPPEKGGAIKVHDSPIPVVLVGDPDSDQKHLKRADKAGDLQAPDVIAGGVINVRIARFPLGFLFGRKGEAKIEPLDDYSKSRMEVRKTRRGMSFVRAGREIETVDVFPRRETDKAAGLGDWPLLQGYAYHWAMEVSFPPVLDDAFGITNDKQTVRPIEDFWRVLAEEEIDGLVNRENEWQEKARKAHKLQVTAESVQDRAEPTPAERAAQAADVALGELPRVPDRSRADANQELARKAEELARQHQQPLIEAQKAIEERQRFKTYDIDYFDDPNGPFYTPVWVGKQVVVRINRKHAFYETLYSSILNLAGGSLAKEAIDLVLIALAREELRASNPATSDFYQGQRVHRWSPYLASALRSLAREFPESDEEAA